MMDLKILAFKYGIPLKELKNVWDKVEQEISILGISEDMKESFREDCIEVFLEADKECVSYKFLKSGYTNFNEFLDSLLDEDGVEGGVTVSTDFAVSDRPENMLDAPKIKDELEDKE